MTADKFNKLSIHDRMTIHDKLVNTTDLKLIEKYFNDFGVNTPIIGQALSKNPNTPTYILEELSEVERYISNMLANPNVHPELTNMYIKKTELGSYKRKMDILANPKIPKKNLEILSKDSLGMVHIKARKILEDRY